MSLVYEGSGVSMLFGLNIDLESFMRMNTWYNVSRDSYPESVKRFYSISEHSKVLLKAYICAYMHLSVMSHWKQT